MRRLTLNQKEQMRLQVLNGVLQGQLGVDEAATVLTLSERQVWRLLAAYRKEGAAALAHGNRGKKLPNAIQASVGRLVIRLAVGRYGGVNHTHLTELLADREGVVLSRSTVRRILQAAGVASPRRRRPPRHRVRRERMPREGMLVQIDGSDHDWLEGRGPRLCLLLAVDDATSTVPYALFQHHEGTEGYFRLLHGLIERRGVPLALYSDRHGSLHKPRGQQLGPTQFGRAMQELGIQQIVAHSPQAKGRVERMAGTFQDRLVSELRLAAATSLFEANEVLADFLPSFSVRFGVAPAQAQSAYRPLPPGLQLDDVLSYRYLRRVARDNTVQLTWRTLQLLPTAECPSYAGRTVEVRQHFDGRLTVWHEGVRVASQEGPSRLTALRAGLRPAREANHQNGETSAEALANIVRPVQQSRRPTQELLPLPAAVNAGQGRRQPTERQRACWAAIEEARREGLSLRALAKHVGISRNTVKKYLAAAGPPTNKPVNRDAARGSIECVLTFSLTSSA
jgi:transposase